MSVIITLKNGLQFRWERLKGVISRYTLPQPKVYDSLETLQAIKEQQLSLARLGDGEFNLIFGKKIGFQSADSELAEELKKVLLSSDPNLLVCIPDVFNELKAYRKKSRHFWEAYLGRNRKAILDLIDLDKQYGNTNVTRFQTGYSDTGFTERVIQGFKDIWDGRDLVFIEGEKTRLGVGNDLFSNAKSIKRILVPATNAFGKRDDIVNYVKNNISIDSLIILACGPTATVVSSILCKMGYQCLDLGHIDIQYEYYIRGIISKQHIEGKYVNESNTSYPVCSNVDHDPVYLKEIIIIFK